MDSGLYRGGDKHVNGLFTFTCDEPFVKVTAVTCLRRQRDDSMSKRTRIITMIM